MNVPERQFEQGILLSCARAFVVITSQPSNPQTDEVQFNGFIPIVSELDYLLGVPREQELPIQITYYPRSSRRSPLATSGEPRRPSFSQGTCVRVYGHPHIDYDNEGKPHLVLAASDVRPALEDPSITETVWEACVVDFMVGIVVAIPVDRPHIRVYTLRVFAGQCSCSDCAHTCWKGMMHRSRCEVFCVTRKSPRLANSSWPRIRDECAIEGLLAGLYRAGDSLAPLIEVATMSSRPIRRQQR